MKKFKRSIAFVMVLSALTLNLPMLFSENSGVIAYADSAFNGIEITSQPVDYVGKIGDEAHFSVSANGVGLTYQWQVNTSGVWKNTGLTGNKTAELVVDVLSNRLGNQYRCIITDSNGETIISNAVSIREGTMFAIINQPIDYVGNIGDKAKFKVIANGTNLSYQWQVNTSGAWKNTSLTGNNTYELTVDYLTTRQNYKFRCVITDANGNELISDEVGFRKATPLAITSQPENYIGKIGDKAQFKVVAEGEGLTYQWQVYSAGIWKDTSLVGCKTSELTVDFYVNREGNKYRCIVIDISGDSVITNEVSLVKETTAFIKKQPVDYVGKIGDKAKFKVEAEGEQLTYQWQVNTSGTWKNTSMLGSQTPEMTVDFFASRMNYKYRCVINDTEGTELISDEVGFKESTDINIISQPVDYTGIIGDTAHFTVIVEGSDLSYQWQVFTAGTWKNTGLSGNQTSELTVDILSNRIGNLYRCIITDSNSQSVTSDVVTLIRAEVLTLSTLDDIQITPSDSATFTVTATGTGNLTYQWEYLGPEYQWIAMPDTNSATLTINGEDAVDGTQYRCTVSDNYGQSKTSNPATLTVEAPDNACGDNLTYTFEDGVLTLSGSGEMWSYTDAEASPFNDLTITSLIIPDGVTVIGAHAFEDTTIQNPVVLPESVFSVRYKAFWDVQNLDITIENIGCAIYDEAIADTATVRGYESSSAYHCSQLDTMTFISLDEEDNLNAATNKIALKVGDTYQIPATGSGLRYYSFNNDVATVSNTGLVTAINVDEYDNDVKVMVYDKKGRSTVYYFAVVNEQTTPDYGWRYSVVSPACNDQLPFVPFWGERVSLNTDVANIVNWDRAEPTGQFGTAPIVSADDRGNAFVFYFTYDADIRPVKADVTYTENTYQFSNTDGSDWERTYYLPYYAYTAEENTRVYFKAYGSEDLDVRVFDAPGGNEITWDLDGGRAEVTFDVAAGQTVYIQCESGQNQAFEYTMKLSTDAIDTVLMSDNNTYTINPDIAGDLTTYSFTAPSDGTYLVEAKSNKQFYYDIANNMDFTDVEYDENGYQLEQSSNWKDTIYSSDKRIACYYPYLNAGETIYLRGYFDGECTADDFISFRVHAVDDMVGKVSVNDFGYPNELSLNPDDFDRRVFYGTEGTQYIISTNDYSADLVVWDQNWNLVGLDTEYNAEGYTYYFNCDEDQLYHLMVQPQNASDNYGTVRVWVSTQEEIPVDLDTEYTVYNTRKAPVNYTYTAEESGYYYIDSAYTGVNSYELTDDNGIVTENEFDSHFGLYIYNVDNGEWEEYRSFGYLEPGRSAWEAPFYLAEGQEIALYFNQDQLRGTDHIDFSLNWAKPGVLDVDSTLENAIDENSCIWYEFTAPANGTYIFSAESNDGDMEFAFGTNGIEWISNNSSVEYGRELSEGETVYVRIYSSENDGLNYSISVRDANSEFNPTVLESIAPEVSDNAETHSYTVNENEAYIKLEYAPDALSYSLSLQNGYNLEPMAVWFLNANGEGECVGYTNSDGIFTWDMTNDFFGDDDYAFVKLVTEQNPLGYISVDYTYEVIDDIIPEEVCSECGGVDGYHEETCSHYGEVIDDGDDDEYDEYIDDIPVIATIDSEWEEYDFDTDESVVWLKVKMADGPYYNFEATCSVGNRMYVYLPSDMSTVVASDTYDDAWSRVLDFPYYDESGYAYVKLVSSNGSALGTINCELQPAPMGPM